MRSWILIAILALVFAGCEPEAVPEPPRVQQAADYALGMHELVRLTSLLWAGAEDYQPAVDSFAPGVLLTEEISPNLRTLRLGFGNGVPCQDGRERKGTLRLLADPAWPAEGASARVIATDYQVTTRKGRVFSLETGTWELHSMPPGTGGLPLIEHRCQGLVWQSEATLTTFIGPLRHILLLGSGTATLTDDLILLDGNTRVNLDGETWDIRLAPPLFWRENCPNWRGGKIRFSHSDLPNLILDFGVDSCAENASLRIGEDSVVTIGFTD